MMLLQLLVVSLLVLFLTTHAEEKVGLLGKLKKFFAKGKSASVSKPSTTAGVPIIDIGPLFGQCM